ncbi:hypothetical protein ACJJTC_014966 [Scirpophaga incertulas]
MEELNERLRNLQKRLAKKSRPEVSQGSGHHKSRDRHRSKPVRTRRIQTPSSSNSSSSGSTHRRRKQSRRIYSSSPSPLHLNFSVSSEKKEGEATVPEQIVATNTGDVVESETLPAAIEEILGQDGLVDNPNSLKLHESLSKRWSAILLEGLNSETKLKLLKKYNFDSNRNLLHPPKLNDEVAAAMNENAIKRDNRIKEQQKTLVAAIYGIGIVLNKMLFTDNTDDINTLSDTSRLLCGLYHDNSMTRRSLILPGLNKDVKETLEKPIVTEYLFGDKLLEKVKSSKKICTGFKKYSSSSEESIKEFKLSRPTTTSSASPGWAEDEVEATISSIQNKDESTKALTSTQTISSTSSGPSSPLAQVQAGRLKYFFTFWNVITCNPTILNWNNGGGLPPQAKHYNQIDLIFEAVLGPAVEGIPHHYDSDGTIDNIIELEETDTLGLSFLSSEYNSETIKMSETKKKSREKILEEKRKASKLRYNKIKMDLKLYELRKQKDKENYLMKKKNKSIICIKDKSVDEQLKQRDQWRKNSRAYYRRQKQKKPLHVSINENDNDTIITDHNLENDTDPLEPSTSQKSNTSIKNKREPNVTILSDVKVNFHQKKLIRSGHTTHTSTWQYNVSSTDVGKHFKELKNKDVYGANITEGKNKK